MTADGQGAEIRLRDQNMARPRPATMCHTPHQAAMIAMPPRPSKKSSTWTRITRLFPESALDPEEAYTVELAPGLSLIDGTKTAQSHMIQFTGSCPNPQADGLPDTVSDAFGDSGSSTGSSTGSNCHMGLKGKGNGIYLINNIKALVQRMISH